MSSHTLFNPIIPLKAIRGHDARLDRVPAVIDTAEVFAIAMPTPLQIETIFENTCAHELCGPDG